MRIHEVAEKLNISARAIRFYEEKGLLAPAKEPHNGYRIYSDLDLWRLQTVIALREAGLSVADMRSALDTLEKDGPGGLDRLLDLQRSVLYAKWLELQQAIETTDRMIGLLRERGSDVFPLERLYPAAEHSRKQKELRNGWRDRWNFDELASGHDRRVEEEDSRYPYYREVMDTVVRWVSAKAGDYGLDLAAGTGNLGGRFLESGIRMAAVDQSREMLHLCQTKFPSMEARLGNFLAIPFPDRTFDFAVSSYAFHLLTEEQQTLALYEIKRVLKPRGKWCVAAPLEEDGVRKLLGWLEEQDYVTKHRLVGDSVAVVYGIPNL